MKIWQDFKEFAFKGNVVDLAVAVVIGAAFGKIVTSLVNDIIMPIVSLLIGKVNFSNLFFAFDGKHYPTAAAAAEAGVGVLNYGSFIQNIVDFLIIAFFIFLAVKLVNRTKKKPAPAPKAPPPRLCPYCKTEIPKEAIRCPHCTSQLTETDIA